MMTSQLTTEYVADTNGACSRLVPRNPRGRPITRRLSGHRVAIAWVHRGIAIAMEDDNRNGNRTCRVTGTANADGMSRAIPHARPECTAIVAKRSG
jgi:hypothetical protein